MDDEAKWIERSIMVRDEDAVDEMFAEEYANLFPNLEGGYRSPPHDLLSDKCDTDWIWRVTIDRYMELWGEHEEIPHAEDIYERVEADCVDLIWEQMEAEYSEDEDYQNDEEYHASIEEMYYDEFNNVTHMEIERKIYECLDFCEMAYRGSDQVQVEKSRSVGVDRVYNSAQSKLFNFPFSDVVKFY